MKIIARTAAALLATAPLAAAAAETPAAEAPAAAAPSVNLSGMVDSFFTVNLTEPQGYESPTGGYSRFTGFNLNFAKVTATLEAGKAGFRLDLGFGPEGKAITTTTGVGDPDGRLFVQQAFASYRLGTFTVEAGRFVTPAGFEVYEAKDNWLYSKGLIFQFALPTSHEGVRVSAPLGEGLTATAYLANGSNLFDTETGLTRSPYKTGIVSLAWAKDGTNATATLMLSKVPGLGDDVFLADLVATQAFGALSVNVSGDYGRYDPRAAGDSTKTWWALGSSAKLAVGEPLAVVGRVELLSDAEGHHTLLAAKKLMSFTGGVNVPVGSNAEVRAELRLDRASSPIYQYGSAEPSRTIATATAAAIAWF